MLLAQRFVPNFKPVGQQRFDYGGAITLLISVLSFLLALSIGQELGFGDGRILALLGNWVVFLIIFIVIEWRAKQPMIDLRLFRNSLFSVNLVTGFITFTATAGLVILMPFYLEDVLGYAPLQVGLFMAIVPIGMGLLAPPAGSLSDRFGTRPIVVIGLAAMVVGYYAMSTLTAETTVLGYVLRLLPIGVGMGVFQSPNNSAIMGSAPRERLGIASGLLSETRTLGQITGIAILGALWASQVIFHHGANLPGGATTAPKVDQVAGLEDTFLAVTVLVALGLGLSIWGLVQERRLKRRQQQPQAPGTQVSPSTGG